MLSVNHVSVINVSVINWVNAHEKSLPEQVVDASLADTTETDELFTYIGKKTSKPT